MKCKASKCGESPVANGTFFFANTSCAYFPCHEGIDPERFNCLFCYCPLYPLGEYCGGDYTYTDKGYKDCSHCTIVHDGERGAELVRAGFMDLSMIAWENRAIVRERRSA